MSSSDAGRLRRDAGRLRRRTIAAAALSLMSAAVSACTVQPLYGPTPSGAAVPDILARIAIDPVDTRVAQLVMQGELSPPEPAGTDSDVERRPGGASFILPIETIRPVYESLRKQGRVPHGFLGVRTRPASVPSVSGGAKTPIGALVESVVPGGPAESAGLKPGDLIVAYEKERVEYPEQLARWVAATRPGATVELVWVRDEVGHTSRTALGESPDPLPLWVLNDTDADTAQPPVRVSELEREIRRLSDELERIKKR